MNTIKVTDEQLYVIVFGLRVAAHAYKQDAEKSKNYSGVEEQFLKQAREATAIADMLEE